MENNNGVISKKTMGRRKIEIKKIEKKTSLQVTFTKRRMGLFRKASELSVLCGAEIAILVQSPADKIFSYGHPSVEALVDRFQNNGGGAFSSASTSSSLGRQIVPWAAADDGRSKYEEAVRKLENEKRSMMKQGINIDVMELHELEEYVEAMEALKNNVLCRLEEMSKLKLQADFASTSNYADRCNYRVLPLQTINDQEFHGDKSEFEVPKAEGNEDDHISAVLQMEKGSIGGSCSSADFIANRTDDDDDDGGAMINIYKDMLCFDENPNFSGCFI